MSRRKKSKHGRARAAKPDAPAPSAKSDAQKQSSGPHASDLAAPADTSWPRRFFYPLLAVIILAALICRIAMLEEYLGENALAGTPINDAKTYWDWAGRIAGGALMQDVPFFSAPLYPYLLGLLRAAGGTLAVAYGIQILLDLLTAGLLAIVARRRFNAGVGLLAAALFLLLQETASSALRILPSSLELILMTATWAALIAVQTRPTVVRHIIAGAVLGVLCLAYAPAMLLVLAVLVWLIWQSRWRFGGVLRAAACAAAAIVVIAPATAHNLAASGELIFIRSGGGITLRQGNHPDSRGGYTDIPGISTHRDRMHEDVLRVYGEATGNEPTFKGADRYFRNQVLAYWRSEPGRAISLAATKFYWFISGRNYGDIYQPTAEIDSGVSGRLRLAPLPVVWLIGPVLIGLVLMLRHPVRSAPEWLMMAVPLFVVVVFFYSPRYRLPAAPAMIVIAAWVIEQALHWRVRWRVSIATAVVFLATLPLAAVNRAKGFDQVDPGALPLNLAYALEEQGDLEAAIERQREGLQFRPDDVAARVRLGDWLRDLGRQDDALVEYARADSLNPDDADLLRKIGEILLQQRKFPAAEAVFQRAVDLAPEDPALLSMLGGAKQLQGRREEACGYYERALELAPGETRIRAAYADLLMRLERREEARGQFERVVREEPDHYQAQFNLGVLYSQLGDNEAARASFERALFINPKSMPALHALGVLSAMDGRLEEATRYVRRALAIDPGDQRCRALQQRIRQMEAEQRGGEER